MKKVLITGASRGIGAACAKAFAEKGCSLYLNYNIHEDRAQALRENLKNTCGVDSALYKCDISDSSQVKKMFSEIGAVDVLVNNAGISQQKLFTDITDADWRRMTGVNLDGVFYCSREASREMIRKKSGSIINISSMWGQVGASCEVHYSAAKAGVIGLTKALAKELGPSNIRVNCIAPGVIDTDMMSGFDIETKNSLIDETPLLRLGTPEDIAKAVVFLADENSFITGQVLGVNGGIII